jgi:hypothetical protein
MPRRNPQPIDTRVQRELEQLSPDARRRVLRFARRRTRILAGVGEPIAGDEPSILVQDAITDTLVGVVAWDRKRVDLEGHLCNVVRTRTWNRAQRARKQVRVSLESFMDDDDAPVIAESIDSNHAPTPADASLARAQVVNQLCDELRPRAAGDTSLIAILEAYEAGVYKRQEVMVLTGLPLTEFLNARRRLDRMLAALPDELRSAALETMREAPVPTPVLVAQTGEMTSERNQ